MPDYNIYIRTLNEGGSSSQTIPWKKQQESQTRPWTDETEEGEDAEGEGFNIVQKAITIAKGNPWVAAVIAAVKITEMVLVNIAPRLATEYGDYRFSVSLNNLKTGMEAIFHPISTALNAFDYYQASKNEMYRASQQRQLIGESYSNGSRRGNY